MLLHQCTLCVWEDELIRCMIFAILSLQQTLGVEFEVQIDVQKTWVFCVNNLIVKHAHDCEKRLVFFHITRGNMTERFKNICMSFLHFIVFNWNWNEILAKCGDEQVILRLAKQCEDLGRMV
jgi:hypothetical protein